MYLQIFLDDKKKIKNLYFFSNNLRVIIKSKCEDRIRVAIDLFSVVKNLYTSS